MDQNELKRRVARAALDRVTEMVSPDSIIGVGTGSTTNFFIDLLAEFKSSFKATVSSSVASTARIRDLGISVLETHKVECADIYVDGADEVDGSRALIKGGGGALTQEKIVVSISKYFLCIVDETKLVERLGTFPLPIEVIPSARSAVMRFTQSIGGKPSERSRLTDNGNVIVDVAGLVIDDPEEMEQTLNNLPGVVTAGIFALHRPHEVFVSKRDGSVARL
ncbi:MAG: ribose-5-phosphate isomerase RpiA [Gammaproteobacteria bacterium]|nr:ribose-5-phosphate isomerase RpiA [Gammaproteobacteria bacterium]